MNIAIIDTGITEEATYSNCKVKHFSMSGKELVNKYQKPVDDHGTECFKELMESAGNVELQILDLNILEDKGNLEVESIIRAIEKAIEERVDLINISLGVMDYSKEMYDVCDKAVCNNIVVVSAASHVTLIKVDILKKIAAYFNVTTDYLLGVSDVKRDLQRQMKMNETLDEFYDLVEVYKELDSYDKEMIWSIIQTIKKTSEKREKGNGQAVRE